MRASTTLKISITFYYHEKEVFHRINNHIAILLNFISLLLLKRQLRIRHLRLHHMGNLLPNSLQRQMVPLPKNSHLGPNDLGLPPHGRRLDIHRRNKTLRPNSNPPSRRTIPHPKIRPSPTPIHLRRTRPPHLHRSKEVLQETKRSHRDNSNTNRPRPISPLRNTRIRNSNNSNINRCRRILQPHARPSLQPIRSNHRSPNRTQDIQEVDSIPSEGVFFKELINKI